MPPTRRLARAALLLWLGLAACRTRPIEELAGDGGGAPDLARADLACGAPGTRVDEPPNPGVVACGDTACQALVSACCAFTREGTSRTCQPGCQPPFVAFFCDGPEDCGGDPCCAHDDQQRAACEPGCSDRVVCHRDADCPAGEACVRALSFPSLSGACQPCG